MILINHNAAGSLLEVKHRGSFWRTHHATGGTRPPATPPWTWPFAPRFSSSQLRCACHFELRSRVVAKLRRNQSAAGLWAPREGAVMTLFECPVRLDWRRLPRPLLVSALWRSNTWHCALPRTRLACPDLFHIPLGDDPTLPFKIDTLYTSTSIMTTCEMWQRPAFPLDSILFAITVSVENMSNWNLRSPRTPVSTAPVWMPMRMSTSLPVWARVSCSKWVFIVNTQFLERK